MKLLKKILSLALNIGSGGLWKGVLNVVIIAAILGSIYATVIFVWNGVTYANKHYKAKVAEVAALVEERDKLKNEATNLAFENNELWLSIGKLKTDSLRLEGVISDGEKLRKQQVEQLQTLIKDISTKSKAKDEHILNLESGLMCKTVKIGLFGKKTVTIGKCDEGD